MKKPSNKPSEKKTCKHEWKQYENWKYCNKCQVALNRRFIDPQPNKPSEGKMKITETPNAQVQMILGVYDITGADRSAELAEDILDWHTQKQRELFEDILERVDGLLEEHSDYDAYWQVDKEELESLWTSLKSSLEGKEKKCICGEHETQQEHMEEGMAYLTQLNSVPPSGSDREEIEELFNNVGAKLISPSGEEGDLESLLEMEGVQDLIQAILSWHTQKQRELIEELRV